MRVAVLALMFVLVGCVETTRNKSEIVFLRELDSRMGSSSDCELNQYIRSQRWILQSNDELAQELSGFLSRSQSCADDDAETDSQSSAADTDKGFDPLPENLVQANVASDPNGPEDDDPISDAVDTQDEAAAERPRSERARDNGRSRGGNAERRSERQNDEDDEEEDDDEDYDEDDDEEDEDD